MTHLDCYRRGYTTVPTCIKANIPFSLYTIPSKPNSMKTKITAPGTHKIKINHTIV